ncbi:MAG TPA: CehA/McbA family metallohydrolase [bacterium]|nr:CehA/McbA family metallohydrolase [bacterium]
MKKFFVLLTALIFWACSTEISKNDADSLIANDPDTVSDDADSGDVSDKDGDAKTDTDDPGEADEDISDGSDDLQSDMDTPTADDEADMDIVPDDEVPMNFYFGNFHSHSGISDGEGSAEEIMQWAKNEANVDFYAMTDHSEQIFGGEWNEMKEMTDLYNEDGVFVAIRGFEWSHPLNGHICIYFTDDFNAAYSALWISYIYDWIDEKNAIAQFNHPGREVNVFDDLDFELKVADNMIAIETGNKGDGNNDGEFLPYYIKALDKGWILAPASNQDNHSMNINTHRSVYVGPDLSRQSMIDAMYARRRYSSDDPDIKVTFRLGKDWMGSIVTTTESLLKFTVKIEDNEPVKELQIISNGGNVVANSIIEGKQNSVTWNPEIMVNMNSYYFLKVISEDVLDNDGPDQIALTAPVWIIKQ